MAKTKGRRSKLQVYEDLGEDKKIAERLFLLAAEGLTRDEIRKELNINIATWQVMIQKRDEFPIYMDMVEKGEILGSEKIVNALRNRATGYEYTETHDDEIKGLKIIKKHMPADISAIKYYLNNTQPDKWHDKREIETTITTKNEEIDYSKMSPQSIRELLIASGRITALPGEVVEVIEYDEEDE